MLIIDAHRISAFDRPKLIGIGIEFIPAFPVHHSQDHTGVAAIRSRDRGYLGGRVVAPFKFAEIRLDLPVISVCRSIPAKAIRFLVVVRISIAFADLVSIDLWCLPRLPKHARPDSLCHGRRNSDKLLAIALFRLILGEGICIEIQIVMVVEMILRIEIIRLRCPMIIRPCAIFIPICSFPIEPHIQRCRELPDFPRVQMPPVREIFTAVHKPRAYFSFFRALRDDIDDAAHGL